MKFSYRPIFAIKIYVHAWCCLQYQEKKIKDVLFLVKGPWLFDSFWKKLFKAIIQYQNLCNFGNVIKKKNLSTCSIKAILIMVCPYVVRNSSKQREIIQYHCLCIFGIKDKKYCRKIHFVKNQFSIDCGFSRKCSIDKNKYSGQG